MKAALAKLLRRAADRLAPLPPPRGPVAGMSAIAAANSDERFVDDLVLRDALHRALNRYQPFRPPAQA
ncbi:MAG TPA: hypothetical protein VFK05_35115 [Polyangiaceae bacterium]|nr:hypothetical protein [Polyangiaceae bacterium]